jgi:hypothetical protein
MSAKKLFPRVLLIALVVCLIATVLPSPPTSEAITMIPIMDLTQGGNMILAFAQRVMAYATQLLQYYNRYNLYRSRLEEWTGLNPGRYAFRGRPAWLVTDLFGCKWSGQYNDAINATPGAPDAAAAYKLGIVASRVLDCGASLPNDNWRALDRQRRKIENATVEALHTAGISKSDARHIDEQVGPLIDRIGSGGSTETSEKAIAQKNFAAHALNLPFLRNIQRQQDAIIQLQAARLAVRRDAQTAAINDYLLTQQSLPEYRALIGAK